MVSAREMVGALYGIWRLVRFDEGGLAFFNASLDGFWRSYWAAALVAPFYLIMLSIQVATGEVEQPARYLAVQSIALVVGWVAYPLAMVHLARLLEREEAFFDYMVPYNWFHVARTVILLPLAMVALSGILPEHGVAFLSMIALSVMLIYDWFIASRALTVDGMTAAGLVLVDFLLTLVVNGIAESMI